MPIEVTPSPLQLGGGLSLVTPRGFCVEGLSLEAAPAADGVLIKPFTANEIDDLVWRTIVERDRARTPADKTR